MRSYHLFPENEEHVPALDCWCMPIIENEDLQGGRREIVHRSARQLADLYWVVEKQRREGLVMAAPVLASKPVEPKPKKTTRGMPWVRCEVCQRMVGARYDSSGQSFPRVHKNYVTNDTCLGSERATKVVKRKKIDQNVQGQYNPGKNLVRVECAECGDVFTGWKTGTGYRPQYHKADGFECPGHAVDGKVVENYQSARKGQ